jgi:hypothetical protein
MALRHRHEYPTTRSKRPASNFSVTRGESLARRLDRRGIRQIEAKALLKLKHP